MKKLLHKLAMAAGVLLVAANLLWLGYAIFGVVRAVVGGWTSVSTTHDGLVINVAQPSPEEETMLGQVRNMEGLELRDAWLQRSTREARFRWSGTVKTEQTLRVICRFEIQDPQLRQWTTEAVAELSEETAATADSKSEPKNRRHAATPERSHGWTVRPWQTLSRGQIQPPYPEWLPEKAVWFQRESDRSSDGFYLSLEAPRHAFSFTYLRDVD